MTKKPPFICFVWEKIRNKRKTWFLSTLRFWNRVHVRIMLDSANWCVEHKRYRFFDQDRPIRIISYRTMSLKSKKKIEQRQWLHQTHEAFRQIEVVAPMQIVTMFLPLANRFSSLFYSDSVFALLWFSQCFTVPKKKIVNDIVVDFFSAALRGCKRNLHYHWLVSQLLIGLLGLWTPQYLYKD